MSAVRASRNARVGLTSLFLFMLPALSNVHSAGAQTPSSSAPAVPVRHSSVHFQDGLLTVTASNASLNGLLHEIARTTGMKISGNVPEDRVFGNYGPEDPQRVLATLLDGTGTNILIVSNQADKPLELVLTRRTGGVTPPNPAEVADADTDEDSSNSEPVRTGVPGTTIPRTVGQRNTPGRVPPASTAQPSEVSQPVVFAPIGATSAPATGTTTPVNPDNSNDAGTENVKTPQQIFEQLQRLQQTSGSAADTLQSSPQP